MECQLMWEVTLVSNWPKIWLTIISVYPIPYGLPYGQKKGGGVIYMENFYGFLVLAWEKMWLRP